MATTTSSNHTLIWWPAGFPVFRTRRCSNPRSKTSRKVRSSTKTTLRHQQENPPFEFLIRQHSEPPSPEFRSIRSDFLLPIRDRVSLLKLKSLSALTASQRAANRLILLCSNLSTLNTFEPFSISSSPRYFEARPGPKGKIYLFTGT